MDDFATQFDALMARKNAADQMDDPVLIFSGEWHLYWRPNASGYTGEVLSAGIYERKEAEGRLAMAGPEKQLEIRELKDTPNDPDI